MAEQTEIVWRVEALIRLVTTVEQRLGAATQCGENLTQAILAKAFCGELVPTEAELAAREGREYEPATVLLERIAAERPATTNGKRSRRSRKARKSAEAASDAKPPTAEPAAPPEEETRASERKPSDNGRLATIDEIDRDEIMAVIRDLFPTGEPRDRHTLLKDLSAAFGFQRLGTRIRETLGGDVRTAVRRGILDNTASEYRLLCRDIDDYTRDHLIDTLLSAMGGTWWEQPDAIQAATRRLGYRRTGKKIQAAFKSAINGAIRRGLLERDGGRLRRVQKEH